MIRYAGVDLLLEDPAGEVAEFLSRHQPLEDLRLFGSAPVATLSPLRGPRAVNCLSLGVPVVNYPAPPRLRINSLWWPTGATRWARFIGLVDGERLDEIMETIGGPRSSGYTPQSLVLIDPEGGTVSTEMYALPPRPVSAGSESRLWLLPLVDDRYWWQFRSGVGTVSGLRGTFDPDDWDEAFEQLKEVLELDSLEHPEIASAFGKPDPTELHRDHQNAAVLLDAVAHSVGCRVVRTTDGDVKVVDHEDAATSHEENASGQAPLIAGGDYTEEIKQGAIAGTVAVVFRDAADPDMLREVEKSSLDYEDTIGAEDAVKTYVTPSSDPFTSDEPSAESDALADALASAYYGWAKRRYAATFAGLKEWTPSGFEDAVEWSFGRRMTDGTFQAETRVQSLPQDVGVDVVLCQTNLDATEECARELVRVEVKDPFLANGNVVDASTPATPAECYLLQWNQSAQTWDRLPALDTVDVHALPLFYGCAFEFDVIEALRVTGSDGEPRYYALGAGHFFLSGTAEQDLQGSEPPPPHVEGMTVQVQGDLIISRKTGGPSAMDEPTAHSFIVTALGAHTMIREGESVVMWWDYTHWCAAKIGDSEPGCGLRINDDEESDDLGKLEVDVEALAGCGLEVDDSGDCDSLKIDPTALAGPGLAAVPDSCQLTVQLTSSCGIAIAGGAVALDYDQIAGDGLEAGECELTVKPGCGIDVDSDGVKVFAADVAGDGLIAGSGCAIDVNPGCGLELSGGAVRVKNSDLTGTGIQVNGTCGLKVDTSYINTLIRQWIRDNFGFDITACCVWCWTGVAWTLRGGGGTCETPPVGDGDDDGEIRIVCEPCTGPECAEDCAEESIDITIVGIVDGDDCAECETFNDTVTLPRFLECEFRSAEFTLCEETWRWSMEPSELGWTLSLERLDGDEWVTEAVFTGTGCQGDFGFGSQSAFLEALCDFSAATIQTDPKSCADCTGDPVYVWDGAAWDLEDECDCAVEDSVEPVGDGAFIGDRECGTCAGPVSLCGCTDIPATLNGEFVASLGDGCPTLDGETFTVTYDSGTGTWLGNTTVNGINIHFRLRCTGSEIAPEELLLDTWSPVGAGHCAGMDVTGTVQEFPYSCTTIDYRPTFSNDCTELGCTGLDPQGIRFTYPP